MKIVFVQKYPVRLIHIFFLFCEKLRIPTSVEKIYFYFQTEEWTSEQRKSHRYQDSSGNEDKLEKYIRHRCVISFSRLFTLFIKLHCVMTFACIV